MNYVEKNKDHYDKLYQSVNADVLVNKVRNLAQFLPDALATDTSWRGLYLGGFEKRLKGQRVLELGAGDGLNALVMGALGAEVVAIDLSEKTPLIVQSAAASLGLQGLVKGIAGDFLQTDEFPDDSFDFVVGKAFLHHLDHDLETAFLRKIAQVLRPEGEARFLEPATNSATLDQIRFAIPVPGRPSSLHTSAFRAWQEADPHPKRDNSSAHFRESVTQFFGEVEITCIGSLERLHRLLPKGDANRAFRRMAFRAEKLLPHHLNEVLGRSQAIFCKKPRKSSLN
jgi:2-polyprenyl-3-methyl-5-hydroxy-6-metoxy-1,4-benzoquinol methylase